MYAETAAVVDLERHHRAFFSARTSEIHGVLRQELRGIIANEDPTHLAHFHTTPSSRRSSVARCFNTDYV
jgi:hypothetical protein